HLVDLVIGADGANSLVRKKLTERFERSSLSVAAGYFVHGVSTTDIVVRCMSEQPGYLWSFPRPDHLAVGVCAPVTARAGAPALRAQSLAWITSQMFDPACRLEPYAWPIPSVRVTRGRHPRVSGPGWMLLGDAAGLVDPLTREGIYFALLSAAWAAEEL